MNLDRSIGSQPFVFNEHSIGKSGERRNVSDRDDRILMGIYNWGQQQNSPGQAAFVQHYYGQQGQQQSGYQPNGYGAVQYTQSNDQPQPQAGSAPTVDPQTGHDCRRRCSSILSDEQLNN